MSKNICGIYAIENKENNKIYIGQSSDLVRRKQAHYNKLNHNKHENYHLQKSWLKYGANNFSFKILKECTIDELDNWEKWFIGCYQSYNPNYGYNHEYGGCKNKKLTKETKLRMSEVKKGEKNPMYGKKLSEEHRQKLINSITGEKNPNYGKPLSDEVKRKLSEFNLGKEIPEKTKRQISKTLGSTGIYKVSKCNYKKYKQGYTWVYTYTENGKHKRITSVDLQKLEKKVKEKGLEWFVFE